MTCCDCLNVTPLLWKLFVQSKLRLLDPTTHKSSTQLRMPSNCKLLTRHDMHDMLTTKPRPEIQVMILSTSCVGKLGVAQVVSDLGSSTRKIIWGASNNMQRPCLVVFGPFFSCCFTQITSNNVQQLGPWRPLKGSPQETTSAQNRDTKTLSLCKILYGHIQLSSNVQFQMFQLMNMRKSNLIQLVQLIINSASNRMRCRKGGLPSREKSRSEVRCPGGAAPLEVLKTTGASLTLQYASSAWLMTQQVQRWSKDV